MSTVVPEPPAVLQDSIRHTRPRPKRHRRVVVDAQGRIFGSLTEAAFVHRLWPNNLSVLVNLRRHGWRDATPEEIAQLDAGDA